jgi:hypothetical protein
MITPLHQRYSFNPADLQDYQKWKGANPGFSLGDYAFNCSTPDLLVALASTFSPNFILHEEGIFLFDGFSASVYDEWLTKFDGNIASVEKMMNHRHLRDLFMCYTNLSAETIQYLTILLIRSWQGAVRSQFPERQVVIESDWNKSQNDMTITIWQTT